MTKVSIITPIFNGAHFIMDAASSVCGQSFKDWEWIIINDGSTDETAALLASLEDPRIQVIHQANAGASAARNAGLDRMRGEYVTFLDADDLLPPDALELRAAYLDAEPGVDILHGGVRVTSQGRLLRHYHPDLKRGPLLNRLARLEEGVFFGVIYMLKRSCIADHRFNERLSHCEDLLFFVELAHSKALRYAAIPDVIYNYRVQSSSAMSNLDGLEKGYLHLLKESQRLSGLSPVMRDVQRQRIQRILVRSWLRRFRPDRAIEVLIKLRLTAQYH